MQLHEIARRNSPSVWQVQSANTVSLWTELKERFKGLRGEDRGANKKPIPRTTVADVKLLATRWSTELMKVRAENDSDRSEHSRWAQCLDEVREKSKGLDGKAIYPGNEHFWQKCTLRVAIYLESRKVRPSRWTLIRESVGEAIAEVPTVAGRATKATAEVAASLIRDPAKFAAVLLGGAILIPPLIRAFRR